MNRINLICLGVRNMEESLQFYKAIGFKTTEEDTNPPIVFFDNEGSKLELYPIDHLAKDINEANPPTLSSGGFYGITLACNTKSEREVDAMMDYVMQAGGKVVKEPQRLEWGGYGGYFQDPNGYYWEVAYGKEWEFDDSNMLIVK